MADPLHMPPSLHARCMDWSSQMNQIANATERHLFFESVMPELLGDTALFAEIVNKMCSGAPYPDLKRTDIFSNEILLYLDGGRRFSLRMFIYAPGEYSPVHDHSAWGVTGCVNGRLGVVKYRRLDDGQRPGVAVLRRSGCRSMAPGEVEITHPLDQGIHATGADGSEPVVMASIYGTPMRRLYVNVFDPEHNSVVETYPPRMQKRLMARSVRPFLTHESDY